MRRAPQHGVDQVRRDNHPDTKRAGRQLTARPSALKGRPAYQPMSECALMAE